MSEAALDANQIFDAATQPGDLGRYADAGMRRRFAHIIDSLNEYGRIESWARPAAVAQLERLVRVRLELARDWATYPQISEQRIEHPFFVLGSPRTGTSAMQGLLAQGDGFRTPLSWYTRHPSPPPGLDAEADARHIAAEHAYIGEMVNIMPGLLLSHPYIDAGAFMTTEDEEIFAIDFQSIYPFHLTKVPVIPVLFKKITGIGEAFDFHKQFLKQLQWKQPTRHWVCKGTQHHYQVPAIWKAYPDATCVWTHRDPVAFIGSMLGIAEHTYTPVTGVRMRDLAPMMLEGIAAGYDALYDADWLEDERLVHVRFDDFMRDQVGTIRLIYERAGLAFSPAYEARLQQWLRDPANRSDRHGKYYHSLERFGLDSALVKRKFARYYERFLR
jgi:hypothetical protein